MRSRGRYVVTMRWSAGGLILVAALAVAWTPFEGYSSVAADPTWEYTHTYTYNYANDTVSSTSLTGTITYKMRCQTAWTLIAEAGTRPSQPEQVVLKADTSQLIFSVKEQTSGVGRELQYQCGNGARSAVSQEELDANPNTLALANQGPQPFCEAVLLIDDPCIWDCVDNEKVGVIGIGVIGSVTGECEGQPLTKATCSVGTDMKGKLLRCTDVSDGVALVPVFEHGICDITVFMVYAFCGSGS